VYIVEHEKSKLIGPNFWYCLPEDAFSTRVDSFENENNFVYYLTIIETNSDFKRSSGNLIKQFSCSIGSGLFQIWLRYLN